MVSTYLSYDLVTRDIKQATTRIASTVQVKREAEYYEENIKKVTDLDDFLDDYRLYSYAMKAHGLEDMIYAKAFMKKVLESDLTDENSYANKLTDERYRNFAAAFSFTSATKIPQTEAQTDELIGLYTARIEDLDETISKETAYYKAMMGKVTSADQFLADPRLRNYFFTAFQIDEKTYDRTLIRGLLTSNLSDPTSYFNTEILPKVIDATAVIQGNTPTLNAINDRAAAITAKANLQTTYDSIVTARASIATKQAEMAAPGADTVKLQGEIDALNRQIEGTFTNVVSSKISHWNAEITKLTAQKSEPGADVTAIQAQIDAIQANVTTWTADRTTRNTIATKWSEIATLEASKTAAGADVVAIQAQIDTLKADITTATGTLQPLDLPEITAHMNEKQALIDSYNATLPPVGAETDALKASITASDGKAATYLAAAAKYEQIVAAFDFNGDGSVPAGGPMTASNLSSITTDYVFRQERTTRAGALLNDEYYKSKIGSITKVSELLADARLVEYVKASFGLTSTAIVSSTLEFALTSDPDDPASYLNTQYKGRSYYPNLLAFARAFNFDANGNLPAGTPAQTAEQIASTSGGYFSGYNDKADEADEKAIAAYKSAMKAFNSEGSKITTVDELLANKTVYEFAMKAVGLDPAEVSKLTMKNVLKSDLDDPKSFANRQKDERYVEFAKLFNFDSNGDLSWPAMAQDEATLKDFAADYIVQKTRFLKDEEKTAAKKKAEEESQYYQDKIATLKTRDEFLKDRRLVDFVLVARGIDPATLTDDYMKQIFTSDLSDPESFANTEKDSRFAQIAASFNFDASGKVVRASTEGIQTKGEVKETMDLFLRQTLESNEGEANAGVRLALYFERMASGITSAYDILGDTALLEFFRTTYSLPQELSNMDIDMQAKIVEKNLTLSDLADPEKLEKLIRRFTIMYDLANDTSVSPALSVLSGNGSVGISADLMLSISQLRAGG